MEYPINPITKHGLDLIDSAPIDYWYHYIRPEREDYVPSEKTLFENAFRLAVFNFEKFKALYVKCPKIDKRTSTGKSEYLALLGAAEKRMQLLLDESNYDKILAMRDEVFKHESASQLCQEDKLNVKYDFEEKQSGVIIKFKPHFVHPAGVIVNLSSTKDVSEHNFQKEAWDFRHDKKVAIYMDGSGVDVMAFIVVDIEAPHKIAVRYLDHRSINFGRETYLKNCDTYVKCCESGIWSSINPEITETSLPEWAFKNIN